MFLGRFQMLPAAQWHHSSSLCLNSGAASFGGRIWKPITSHHNATRRLSQFEGSSKCSFFSCFWRMHCCCPSWPHISQDSLHTQKTKKEREKMVTARRVACHCHGRNCDARVKYLLTQPGNAPKSRPSHLTSADAVNKVSLKDSPSKTAKAVSFRGCRPWIETSLDRPDLRKWQSTPRDVTIFSLYFLCFGCAKNLGICEAMKDGSSASSKKRERKDAFGGRSLWIEIDFARHSDVIGL